MTAIPGQRKEGAAKQCGERGLFPRVFVAGSVVTLKYASCQRSYSTTYARSRPAEPALGVRVGATEIGDLSAPPQTNTLAGET